VWPVKFALAVRVSGCCAAVCESASPVSPSWTACWGADTDDPQYNHYYSLLRTVEDN
jgi:hypothetical protein